MLIYVNTYGRLCCCSCTSALGETQQKIKAADAAIIDVLYYVLFVFC